MGPVSRFSVESGAKAGPSTNIDMPNHLIWSTNTRTGMSVSSDILPMPRFVYGKSVTAADTALMQQPRANPWLTKHSARYDVFITFKAPYSNRTNIISGILLIYILKNHRHNNKPGAHTTRSSSSTAQKNSQGPDTTSNPTDTKALST
jgi:hypothetical protein